MEEGRALAGRVSARPTRDRPPVRPRGRARPVRRRVISSDEEEGDSAPEAPPPPPSPPASRPPGSHVLDMEADISQLEPATFTTIPRGQPEPMLRLAWNHKVNLIATKVLNPLIHLCEKCDCPILAYGRMIPCKHVLCYDCARPLDKCWRCGERAARVERAGLGKLFMCLHDGRRYDVRGCRRTYLSQRDLQAHINHRHCRVPATTPGLPVPVRAAVPDPLPPPPPPPPRRHSEDRPPPDPRDPRDPRRHEPRTPPAYGHSGHAGHSGGHSGHSGGHPAHGHGESAGQGGHVSPRSVGYAGGKPPMKQQQIPVMTTQRSSNLITIPIQGQESPAAERPPQYGGYQGGGYPPAAPPPQTHSGYQQPGGTAAFYQTTPPPAAGYGRPFPPSGPPPPAYTAAHNSHSQHPPQHPAQHTAQHATQHTAQHAASHGGQHAAHAAPHAQHASQHGAPQPWATAPPLGRPPPASHYYR